MHFKIFVIIHVEMGFSIMFKIHIIVISTVDKVLISKELYNFYISNHMLIDHIQPGNWFEVNLSLTVYINMVLTVFIDMLDDDNCSSLVLNLLYNM